LDALQNKGYEVYKTPLQGEVELSAEDRLAFINSLKLPESNFKIKADY
jgi:hypothetical protein